VALLKSETNELHDIITKNGLPPERFTIEKNDDAIFRMIVKDEDHFYFQKKARDSSNPEEIRFHPGGNRQPVKRRDMFSWVAFVAAFEEWAKSVAGELVITDKWAQTDQSANSINVSSNVLFHFTNKMDNLLNILRKNFLPHYCPEYLTDKMDGPPSMAFAMTCFCDLPLFLIKQHLKRYGSYGIGLKKTWGMKNSLTPVIYTHGDSPPMAFIEGAFKRDLPKSDTELSSLIWLLLSYMKPYEGPAWRNGNREDGIRFYNEREWRYVPETHKAWVLTSEDYLDKETLDQANEQLANNFRLTFNPSDIEYIIVKDESEVTQMIQALGNSDYPSRDVPRLLTCVTTTNRIARNPNVRVRYVQRYSSSKNQRIGC